MEDEQLYPAKVMRKKLVEKSLPQERKSPIVWNRSIHVVVTNAGILKS